MLLHETICHGEVMFIICSSRFLISASPAAQNNEVKIPIVSPYLHFGLNTPYEYFDT